MKHTSTKTLTFTTLSVAVLLALLATSAITPDLGSVLVQAVPLLLPEGSSDGVVGGRVDQNIGVSRNLIGASYGGGFGGNLGGNAGGSVGMEGKFRLRCLVEILMEVLADILMEIKRRHQSWCQLGASSWRNKNEASAKVIGLKSSNVTIYTPSIPKRWLLPCMYKPTACSISGDRTYSVALGNDCISGIGEIVLSDVDQMLSESD
ncbi:MAG: hypothetical protein JOS17DRAFT_786688 [Linnemannia elongata]|nr:MAG: hypothetical protein JOS17DRAFT_786688 [Linnemannia elongata]